MSEGFTTLFLFFGVTILAGVLFAGWIVVMIVKLIIRGMDRAMGTRTPPPIRVRVCRRSGCNAANPLDARFCRRCGEILR
jgi:hypothetical protein